MQALNYDEISEELSDWASVSSCSEIHGLIAGLGSVALAVQPKLVKEIVLRHVEEQDCSELVLSTLENLRESVVEQYEDPEFGFAPLLPDEDEELSLRIGALSQWCQGFLVGFGTGVKAEQFEFSEEAQELLKDLVDISNMTNSLDDEAGEEDEVAYTEVEEYVRAAAMMLYCEFGLAKPSASSSADPDMGLGEEAPFADDPDPTTYH